MRTVDKGSAHFRVVDGDGDGRFREFWDWYEHGPWEPDTVAAFETFLPPGTHYLDLGAWVGPTVFLAAPNAASICCAEPDPVAREVLEQNLSLNPTVQAKTRVLPVAVGAESGEVELRSPKAGGDSMSSVLSLAHPASVSRVRQVAVQELLRDEEIARCDFIKMDVEGAEYWIVPALAEHLRRARPQLYVSTHPNLLVDRSTPWTQVTSRLRALRANRRLLKTLLLYRHHYVYDSRSGRFRDIRRRNRLRVLFPLPLRASVLIGAAVFTETAID
jgi:FkbM family methyltransferase